MDHLELFTDGGAIRIGNKFYGSSAYVIKYQKKYITSTCPVEEGTNNYYELKAMRDGLRKILRSWRCDENMEVWIISDSEYSIKCITKWFKSWRKINGVYYNSMGKPVANIELILEILDLLKQIGNYRFIKVRSHISTNLEKSYEEFVKINKLKITFVEYMLLIRFNELCDENIRKAFNQKRKFIAMKGGKDCV